MKLNISYPVTGTQKVIEIDDDNKLSASLQEKRLGEERSRRGEERRWENAPPGESAEIKSKSVCLVYCPVLPCSRAFYDKRISHEVDGSALGDEFKGYIFKISGGNDKQGFAMMQGVLTSQRVRLLMRDGMPCFRSRKRGERKRKSVRGCIVSSDLSVLNLVIVKKGDNEIEGLTGADTDRGRRLGPKRANKIRKLFNLSKEDDVRKYVVRRTIKKDGKKPYTKAPKIQRLVTPQRLQHKRRLISLKRQHWEKTRAEAAAYNELLALRFKESREARASKLAKKRSESKKEPSTSTTSSTNAPAPTGGAATSTGASSSSSASAPKPGKPSTSAPSTASASASAAPKSEAASAAKTAKPAAASASSGKPVSTGKSSSATSGNGKSKK